MNSFFKGYGRGWGEDKASGIARVFQIMREPCTSRNMYIIAGSFAALELLAAFIIVLLAP